jgi:hypothetical protein
MLEPPLVSMVFLMPTDQALCRLWPVSIRLLTSLIVEHLGYIGRKSWVRILQQYSKVRRSQQGYVPYEDNLHTVCLCAHSAQQFIKAACLEKPLSVQTKLGGEFLNSQCQISCGITTLQKIFMKKFTQFLQQSRLVVLLKFSYIWPIWRLLTPMNINTLNFVRFKAFLAISMKMWIW